jgi:hypothetical protein
MAQVETKAVEAPHDQDIYAPTFRISEQFIECRPAVLRAADPAVDILLGGPAAKPSAASYPRRRVT